MKKITTLHKVQCMLKRLSVVWLCGMSGLMLVSCYESDEEIIDPVYAVDLGLSVKWAWCNLGASSPIVGGSYYAWGETTARANNWNANKRNYKHYDSYTDKFKFIGSNISGTSYDAALGSMGDDWHMPTKDEIQELIDKCTWEWVTLHENDYYTDEGEFSYQTGFLITGPNGNKIFLPGGAYWSGTNESFGDANSTSYILSASYSEDGTIRGKACYDLSFIRPVKGELKVTDDEKENSTSSSIVDLGLSVKWASCNVGATSPEEYGDYFAWGETQIKSTYNSDNSITNGLSWQELFASNIIGDGGNLTPAYDAATAHWGSEWRMPTESEVQELYDKCNFEWTTMNGVYGRRVTGPNGNTIFLPASGFRYGTSLNSEGAYGDFWSATPYENGACIFYYDTENYSTTDNPRYYGRTVRPVYAGVPSQMITITTGDATDITAWGATLFGVVGGTYDPITCGIIYGTSSDMSSPYNKREETVSCENYAFEVTNLHPGTTYYYCAYAIVNGEEKRGEVLSFTTEQGEGNAYEAVDLGLSVMWATYNVGATSPEGYGDYFAWGETQTKSSYYESNSITYGLSDAELENRGIIDAYGNLTPTYDAATVNWGSDWRMPTYEEFEELIDNSTVEWTYVNGMYGYNVKSNINGNSIFLPANGYYDHDLFDGSGVYGFYWVATNYSDSEDDIKGACCLFFHSGLCGYNYYNERNCGQAVRPVTSGISKPEVTIATGEATDVTAYGATLSGTVSGTDETITCGVIYGTSSDLSLNDYREETSANGTYSVSISNLQPGTTYYYCAYVVVDGEYKYGETYSFSTEQESGTGEYEAVDLGLSVKWASFNVGATSPEQYGDYFAWGETETKSYYGSNNSTTYGYSHAELRSLGILDASGNLAPTYDAATANWGSEWRMPTKDEQDELRENCDWVWTTVNGVDGYRVTSRTNGNSIFLPVTGFLRNTSSYSSDYGYYWSATPYSGNYISYYFYFYSSYCNLGSDNRSDGRAVRPVYSEASQPVVTIETGEATDITTDGATLNGTVSGTDEYVTCGFIYGTSSDLSFNDNYIEVYTNGSYSYGVSYLQPGTTYYYRAYVYVDGEYKYGETYSFTTEQESDLGGHEAVDLGLSVKWATCNVGATSPEEYGDYFAWGETVTKESYTSSNNVTDDLTISELKSQGIIDANGNLTAAYDAATANWGGSWRMPTLDEIKELKDECTWEWTTQNGVYGRLVTGPNGNSIFLPAAGYRFSTSLYSEGDFTGYWSATPRSSSSAYYLYFDSDRYEWSSTIRSYGNTVRPVSE